jgi:hypothetical protein
MYHRLLISLANMKLGILGRPGHSGSSHFVKIKFGESFLQEEIEINLMHLQSGIYLL